MRGNTPPRRRLTRAQIRQLHTALLDIVSVINEPQRDDVLIGRAGVSLERGRLPLLVGVDRFGPVSVVELAGRAGRDYTTVSRQLARLESMGLVTRQPHPSDRRVHKVAITPAGRAMTARVDRAREVVAREFFHRWSSKETRDFLRLITKFSEEARPYCPPRKGSKVFRAARFPRAQ